MPKGGPRWARGFARARAALEADSTIGSAIAADPDPSTSPIDPPTTDASICDPATIPDPLITAVQATASSNSNPNWQGLLDSLQPDAPMWSLPLQDEQWRRLIQKADGRGETIAETVGALVAFYLDYMD